MRSKVLGCSEIGIDENAFHNNKTSISTDEVEINTIALFNKTSYDNKGSLKHYIGCRHKDDTFSSLNIKAPQLTGYTKHFNNGDKCINFLINDKELLKNTIKYGMGLKAYLKKNLLKNRCMTINILVLK